MPNCTRIISMYTLEKYLLIILFLGTALAVNPFFNTDVFEFPKLAVLLCVVGILTVVNLSDLERWKKLKDAPKEFLFLGGFLIANVISFILSEDKAASLIGRDMRFQGFLTQVHYVLLALNVFLFFTKYPRGQTKSLFRWLMVGLLIACLLAVSPYFFEVYLFHPLLFYGRVFGPLGNPNYLAAFIIAILPFYILAFRPKVKWKLMLFVTGLILILATLFLTGTRSAWMSAIAGFLLIGILRVIKFKQWKTLMITCSIILVMVGGAVFQTKFADKDGPLQRFSIETENLTSLKTRIHLWQAGLKLSLERPLFGFGQDSIQENIDPYLPKYLKGNDVFFVDRTHSELIDIAVMLGLFGVIMYVGFFLMIFIKSVRHYGDAHFEAALAAFFSLQLFHGVNFSIVTTSVLIYFLAVYLSYECKTGRGRTCSC